MTASRQLAIVHQFGPHLPPACPPSDAKPTEGSFFIGTVGRRINGQDLLSYNEKGYSFAPNLICQSCGLSVWADEEGVHEARQRVGAIKELFITRLRLTPNHGVYKHTPSKRAKRHHTFWRCFDQDLSLVAEPFLEPLLSAADLP